ncbi:hypothetical protein E0486_04635 [Flaviaesturariibacter aridisoli]|uniref:Bacterial Pleckstrin homology domain-containing protein n=2 Tax=Flaviaesturariibacter aridisoli TaxID=2545761 RepID=A0A4R4E7H1_9BACT|nr:hypothetical protein E0486_04635 [Flaviaesturariibacter aridisoli]
MDRSARAVTIFVFALFALVLTVQVHLAVEFPRQGLPIAITISLLFSIIVICLGFRVTALTLTENALLIHRPWRTKTILFSDIQKAEALDREDLSWSLRIFGIGGVFGYYGRFANRKLGAMTWYLTRRDRTVLLRMKNGNKIVISPDDCDGFLEAIQARHGLVSR